MHKGAERAQPLDRCPSVLSDEQGIVIIRLCAHLLENIMNTIFVI